MRAKAKGSAMHTERPVWCGKCHLRVAPYERRTIYRKVEYHQDCFLKLVREEAEDEKARRSYSRVARHQSPQQV